VFRHLATANNDFTRDSLGELLGVPHRPHLLG
jgi:hypothetical protein